jgi:hypothetical protein
MDLDTFSDIDEKTAFQLGFLAFCKEAGLTEEQAIEFVAQTVKAASEPTWGQFGYELGQSYNPWNGRAPGAGTFGYMDKWYNQWTTNTDGMTPGEETLRSIGRVGAGVGAAGWAAAGGLAAGAPALAAMPVSAVPGAISSAAAAAPGAVASGLGHAANTARGFIPSLPTSLGGGLTAAALIHGLSNVAGKGVDAVKSLGGAALDAGKENLKQNGGMYSMLALGALPALGLVAGGALGHGAAKFQEPNVSDDDIKAKELADTYKTYTNRLKARRMYQQYRQARQTGDA